MANSNTSLEALKVILFRTIEGVENLSDPKADQNEKTSIEQAKVIADLSGRAIDIYKTQVAAIQALDKLGVRSIKVMSEDIGIIDNEAAKQITE